MIKLILKGGLGNQMLQYAFVKSISLVKNEPLVLDLSFLDCRIPIKDFTVRDYELDIFGIDENPSRDFNSPFFREYLAYPRHKFFSFFNPSYIVQRGSSYSYDQKLVDLVKKSKNPVIEGFFNNYKYFIEKETEIKNIFNVDKLYNQDFSEIEEKIKNCNSVSISIRRGDYLTSKNKDIFVFLDKEYYTKAISIIKERVKNPHFFIFSIDFPENDDSYFIKDLGLEKNEFTSLGKNYTGFKFGTYLRLKALCKNNIISNSSFAFWGAYLNKNQDKVIIAPKKHMYQYDYETPPTWIQI
jgi:hypothetical protein